MKMTTEHLKQGKPEAKRWEYGAEVRAVVETMLSGIEGRGDAAASVMGAHCPRLCLLEGFIGHAEQASFRVHRYGGRNVPFGETAA